MAGACWLGPAYGIALFSMLSIPRGPGQAQAPEGIGASVSWVQSSISKIRAGCAGMVSPGSFTIDWGRAVLQHKNLPQFEASFAKIHAGKSHRPSVALGGPPPYPPVNPTGGPGQGPASPWAGRLAGGCVLCNRPALTGDGRRIMLRG